MRSVASADDSLIAVTKREAYAVGLGTGASTLLQGAAVVAALVAGIPAVVSGEIAPVWLAVLALLPLALFEVLASVPTSAIALQRLHGSVNRIAEIDSSATATDVDHNATVIAPGNTRFTGFAITNLCARWPQAPADNVRNISLEVKPGQRIAIVGPSGSGKSTLVATLMGFLPYRGSALLNGIEIREQGSDAVCAQVGLLTQQAHIFDTTVGANVHIGSPHREVDEAAIFSALAQAQLLPWVETLPDGVNTEVGSFGTRMSGGERQRLALARLLIARRDVLILDEPTEHLDAQTSREVDATIQEVTHDRTTITVSHNLSAISASDVIHVMESGQIIASGNHAQLLLDCDWYRAQWEREQESLDMELIIAGASHE
jgi:ATP-binding cassette subfamily C protein CydC